MTWGWKGTFNRALEFPGGAVEDVAPPGRGRLRYNENTDVFEMSMSGGAYVQVGQSGAAGGWVDVGTTVRLATLTDQVVIGAAAPTGTEKLGVVGDTLLTGDLEVSGVVGDPIELFTLTNQTAQVQLGVLDIDQATPASLTASSYWNFSAPIPQAGIDDLVMSLGINFRPEGNTYNALLPGIALQFEDFFLVSPGVRKVECHFGEYRPIGGSGPNNRRWVSCQIDVDTHAIVGGAAGEWQWYDSDRSTLLGKMTEAGQLQTLDSLYITSGGDKSILLVEKFVAGSTWAPISLLSTDKIALKFADASATDGDIRFGTSFDIKWLIGASTKSFVNAALGIINIGENDAALSGINITVPTSGSGLNLYLGAVAALQVAFDGLYLAKGPNMKWGINGVSPSLTAAVTGSRADPEAALANLLTALATKGIIVNSTTA